MPSSSSSSSREEFERIIRADPTTNNSGQLSLEKYRELIDRVNRAKISLKSEPNSRRLLAKYDIIQVNGERKLIDAKNKLYTTRIYVHEEELYDIIEYIHKSLNHAGRDRMRHALNDKYANVSIKQIMTFITLCEVCAAKQRNTPKNITNSINKMPSKMFERSQIDFIDLSTLPDGDYRHILLYQDYVTKFMILSPLSVRTPEAVEEKLIDIFSVFGPPMVLQSNTDREFHEALLERLNSSWLPGKITHSDSKENQASVHRAKQVVKDKLMVWMNENDSSNWSRGIQIVQYHKNTSYHAAIKMSPFEAMFGHSGHNNFNNNNNNSADIKPAIKVQRPPDELPIKTDVVVDVEEEEEDDDNMEMERKKNEELIEERIHRIRRNREQILANLERDEDRKKSGACPGEDRGGVGPKRHPRNHIFANICRDANEKNNNNNDREEPDAVDEQEDENEDVDVEKKKMKKESTNTDIESKRLKFDFGELDTSGQGFFKCTCTSSYVNEMCICQKISFLCRST